MAATYSNPNAWPQSEVDLLIDLASKGKSSTQIARVLGPHRSRNAVIGKCLRMGIQLLNKPGWQVGSAKPPPMKKVKLPVTKAIALPPIGPVNEYAIHIDCCQFEVPTGDGPDFQLCGHPTARNARGRKTPYCSAHRDIVYQPMKSRANTNPATVQVPCLPSAP